MRVAALALTIIVAYPTLSRADFSIDWQWKASHRCNNTSPALSLTDIPEGTKKISIQMNDLDFQNKSHGGDTIDHAEGNSAEIPEGALKANYLGPCPNNFSSFGHSYQITARALDSNNNELAKTFKAKDFSARTAK